jgi:two-component system NtrC family sensor kinase
MTLPIKFENYFRVFRDILRSIYSTTSLQEVLNVVVTKTAKVMDAKGALLRILNQETQQFDVGAVYGLGEHYITKGPVSTEKLLHDPSELHKVKIITDIWHAPRVEYPQQTWDEGIRMILDVPMAIENKMRGLIRLYLTKPRTFSPDELDFMVTVAEQCACIIERVRLAENQQTHITHLATQMEKMSSLGRMAAGVAHEINNPLAGILLFSSNMSKKVDPGSPLEKGLKIIIRETLRCKAIIQGLLEFARDKPPKKVMADINDVIRTAMGVVENQFYVRHVSLEPHLAQDMVKTPLDKNQIEQVFINLLLNALQAVKDHGRVSVKSMLDSEKNRIEIEIADNGCGISVENVKKIFEPFYTTRADGTGLGLAVSYGIIENHRGNIRVSSKLGEGTRFVIDFPILDEIPGGKEDA